MRLHSYYTERVLARPPALARIGAIAALAHERLDGSGYHRGLSGPAIPVAGRILAAADAYHAMTEPRPHRPALSAKQAAAALRAEVRAGRLDADAVDAVLDRGRSAATRRRAGPAGLTPREIEVLVLIARGASTRAGRPQPRHHARRPPAPTSSASTPRPAPRPAPPPPSSPCSTACWTASNRSICRENARRRRRRRP